MEGKMPQIREILNENEIHKLEQAGLLTKGANPQIRQGEFYRNYDRISKELGRQIQIDGHKMAKSRKGVGGHRRIVTEQKYDRSPGAVIEFPQIHILAEKIQKSGPEEAELTNKQFQMFKFIFSEMASGQFVERRELRRKCKNVNITSSMFENSFGLMIKIDGLFILENARGKHGPYQRVRLHKKILELNFNDDKVLTYFCRNLLKIMNKIAFERRKEKAEKQRLEPAPVKEFAVTFSDKIERLEKLVAENELIPLQNIKKKKMGKYHKFLVDLLLAKWAEGGFKHVFRKDICAEMDKQKMSRGNLHQFISELEGKGLFEKGNFIDETAGSSFVGYKVTELLRRLVTSKNPLLKDHLEWTIWQLRKNHIGPVQPIEIIEDIEEDSGGPVEKPLDQGFDDSEMVKQGLDELSETIKNCKSDQTEILRDIGRIFSSLGKLLQTITK